jgi:hypothetical protein
MKKTKLLVCCLLTITTTSSFANNNQQRQEKNTVTIENAENPFYPKYLNENIQHAVDAIVNMKLREDRKKLIELQRKEKARIEKERKEKLAKQQGKSKRSYAKIPNSVTAKSLTKNDLGGYEIVTKSGTILKKGSRVYNGIVTAITSSFIHLDRNEKGTTRHYKIKYNVSF